MTDAQIWTVVISAMVAMVALGLISWGFSGLFVKPKNVAGHDLAAELERKNLAAKRRSKES